jgi:hypothetical protein
MPDGWSLIEEKSRDGRVIFNMSDVASRIYQIFNNKTENTQYSFLYLFSDDNYFTNNSNTT